MVRLTLSLLEVEFAREKEVLFDCWCAAKQVDHDYHKLRQLLLECLQSDVKMYIDEQKADSLPAVLADDYSLTKTAFPSKTEQSGAGSDCKSSEAGRRSPPITRSRNHNQGRGQFDDFCVFAGGSVCYAWSRDG